MKKFEVQFQELKTEMRKDSLKLQQINNGVDQIDNRTQDIYEIMCEKIKIETDEMAAKHS